jgi:hypothetical protein
VTEEKGVEANPNDAERVQKRLTKGISVSYSPVNKDLATKVKEFAISTAITLGILYFVYYEIWQLKGFEFAMLVMFYFFSISTSKYLIEMRNELKRIGDNGAKKAD